MKVNNNNFSTFFPLNVKKVLHDGSECGKSGFSGGKPSRTRKKRKRLFFMKERKG